MKTEMATADQIKSLIRSHFSDDIERFTTVALQLAAHEANQGHGALAHEIRQIVDKAKSERGRNVLLKFPQELHGLALPEVPQTPIASLIVAKDLRNRIDRTIHEFRQQHKLKAHALSNRRKILLIGPPGTGKTMTARVLAHELRMPLYTIQVDKLVTKFMGETGAKLRQIFDLIQRVQGVYLFDEFDAIGGERSLENDVGEMRRVLNAFLQFIEADTSDSLIIATTNSPRLLDKALYRRFDDVLYYSLPDDGDKQQLMENIMGSFLPSEMDWHTVIPEAAGLSHSEIDLACRDAIKQTILADKQKVDASLLSQMLRERRDTHQRLPG
jgi:SpoVK/Ycf46/Vps4 family AAA+-type ATPase